MINNFLHKTARQFLIPQNLDKLSFKIIVLRASGARVKVHVLRSIQCDTNTMLRQKNFHRHPVTSEMGQEARKMSEGFDLKLNF